MELKEQAIQEILKSRRGAKRVLGYKYLIGKTMHGFGIAVAWNASGEKITYLTMEIHKEILSEVKNAGLKKPIKIYASANGGPNGSPSYEFIAVGDEYCSLKQFVECDNMELKEEKQILDKLRENYNNFVRKHRVYNKQSFVTQLMLLGDLIIRVIRHCGNRGLEGPQFALILDEISCLRIDHTFGNLRENYRKMTLREVEDEFDDHYWMLRRDLNVLKCVHKELKAMGR